MPNALSLTTMSKLFQEKRPLSVLLTFIVALLLFVVPYVLRGFLGGKSGDSRKSSSSKSVKKSSSKSDGKKSSSRTSSTGSSSSKHKKSSKKKADPNLPSLIVLVGIHGSGKSTWAKQYLEKVHKSCIVVSSDVIRGSLTGTITDFSKEEEVEEEMLRQVLHHLKLKRSCIVDDCTHNLEPAFRAKLLSLVKDNQLEVNKVVHLFPIKPLFAQCRLDQDISDGKKRFVPTPLEMEKLNNLYSEAESVVKKEGWIENN